MFLGDDSDGSVSSVPSVSGVPDFVQHPKAEIGTNPTWRAFQHGLGCALAGNKSPVRRKRASGAPWPGFWFAGMAT